MSKVGRKPISIAGAQVEVKGNEIHYKGPNASGVHELPKDLHARIEESRLLIAPDDEKRHDRKVKTLWGLHRALLSGKVLGCVQEFQKTVHINGLGYKAAQSGDKLVVSLGYSHKIDFPLPQNVSVDIDKTGQKVTFKSFDKALVGLLCSKMRDLRPPEPYKGTGVKLADEVIARKSGKAKSAA